MRGSGLDVHGILQLCKKTSEKSASSVHRDAIYENQLLSAIAERSISFSIERAINP